MVLSLTLLLEDDPVSAYITTKILKKFNPEMEVVTVSNGAKAIEYLETHELPKLIIFDLHMPVMNGFDFLQMLHNHEIDICNHCICAASNVFRPQEKERLLSLNCTEFIEKPFTPEKLLEVLERCFPQEELTVS